MKILVTGGSGFIGTRLVGELLAAGHDVHILDKANSLRFPHITTLGDVRDREQVDQSIRGMDLVYHLAAEHRDDVRPVSLYYDVNVDGSRNVGEACAKHGVSRLIFTSSVAVYGLNAGEPSEESAVNPFNDYSRSKLQAETVLRQSREGCPTMTLAIVRPTVVFGEENRGNVYNLIHQIVTGRFFMVGKGENKKSMAYVGNITNFLRFLGMCDPAPVQVFNYADKPDISMNEFVGIVRKLIKKQSALLPRIPYFLGMLGGACFDMAALLTGKTFPISRIRIRKFCADTTINIDRLKETDFVPPFTLQKGLERFVDYEFGERRIQ